VVARLLVSTDSSSAAESAAWATMQKPTRPGHCKLSVLGSTGSKKAVGEPSSGFT
jgi:hypothetical protein